MKINQVKLLVSTAFIIAVCNGGGVVEGIGSAFREGLRNFSRWGYETAPYDVVHKDGKYEIRDYPKMIFVETRDDDDDSFMRLFDYISGENESNTKIPMTTPVFEEREQNIMAFVMPADMTLDEVPVPNDSQVTVR